MNLEKFHSAAIKNAEHCFYKYNSVPAMIFAVVPNGKILMLDRPFHDKEEKQLTYDIYAAIFKLKKVKYFSFISESFFIMSKTPDIPDSIANHPDRKECLFVLTQSPSKQLFYCCEIKREDKIILQPIDFGEGLADGEINNLFHRFDNYPEKVINGLLKDFDEIFSRANDLSWYDEIDLQDFLRVINEQ